VDDYVPFDRNTRLIAGVQANQRLQPTVAGAIMSRRG
jgi:hypothetical protein